METYQAPHQKLSDEQIKEYICDLVVELHEMKLHFIEQMESAEAMLEALKRHFCPEKFHMAKISIKEMSEMFEDHYGHMNLSEPIRMKRNEDDTTA